MPAITISRRFAGKDDLVVIPKREYQEFSRWKNAVRVRLDEKWFWTAKWQEKEKEADRAIHKGQISGPFSDHKKLLAALRRKRK